MPTQITSPGTTITSVDIEDLERKLDSTLPPAYRAFLLQHNGGVPEPATFKLAELAGPYAEETIELLYGISGGNSDLWLTHINFADQSPPKDCLIIGRIIGSLPICIRLAGTDSGSIYLWNWDNNFQLDLIASSFPDFLSVLYDPSTGRSTSSPYDGAGTIPNEFAYVTDLRIENDVQGVKRAIEAGWDVNAKTNAAQTPLERAVYFNQLEMVELLLQHGAILGRSIELARRQGHFDILDLLLKYDSH